MAINLDSSAASTFCLKTLDFYNRLMRLSAKADVSGELSLGGKLLYAAELDAAGRALVVAGNIAGAASLAATADVSAQMQAIRSGAVDFLVTTLDEALRILKNETRKKETVAVCVAADPRTMAQRMEERGVQPDLVRDNFLLAGSGHLASALDNGSDRVIVRWSVAATPALWLPKIDAIARRCIDPEDAAAKRWLRLSSRYLGRKSEGFQLVSTTRAAADRLLAELRAQVETGEMKTGIDIEIIAADGTRQSYHLAR